MKTESILAGPEQGAHELTGMIGRAATNEKPVARLAAEEVSATRR
jgi:hypothetical protein